MPNLVFLSFILSNLSTITFNCVANAVCVNVHKQFTDFSGINLIKVSTYFFFHPGNSFYMLLLSQRTLHLCKQRLAGWERTVHIPPLLNIAFSVRIREWIMTKPTNFNSIFSFLLLFCWLLGQPSATMHRAASWFCYCQFFYPQAFQDSITSQRRRFRRWRRPGKQQRIHRLWYGQGLPRRTGRYFRKSLAFSPFFSLLASSVLRIV